MEGGGGLVSPGQGQGRRRWGKEGKSRVKRWVFSRGLKVDRVGGSSRTLERPRSTPCHPWCGGVQRGWRGGGLQWSVRCGLVGRGARRLER